MVSENEAYTMGRELTRKYGSFLEARCLDADNIFVVMERATIRIEGYRFGYAGLGPRCFHSLLESMNVRISLDTIQRLGAPSIIKNNGQVSAVEKKEAESEIKTYIMSHRQSSGQCTMCGKPLSFINRLFKKSRHKSCTLFKE